MPQFEKMMEAVVKESPVRKQVAGAGSALQLAAETTNPGISKMENVKGQPAGEEAAQKPVGRSSKAISGDVKERIIPQRRMMDPPASKSTAKSFIGKQLF